MAIYDEAIPRQNHDGDFNVDHDPAAQPPHYGIYRGMGDGGEVLSNPHFAISSSTLISMAVLHSSRNLV
jgi:hypothetical protein